MSAPALFQFKVLSLRVEYLTSQVQIIKFCMFDISGNDSLEIFLGYPKGKNLIHFKNICGCHFLNEESKLQPMGTQIFYQQLTLVFICLKCCFYLTYAVDWVIKQAYKPGAIIIHLYPNKDYILESDGRKQLILKRHTYSIRHLPSVGSFYVNKLHRFAKNLANLLKVALQLWAVSRRPVPSVLALNVFQKL